MIKVKYAIWDNDGSDMAKDIVSEEINQAIQNLVEFKNKNTDTMYGYAVAYSILTENYESKRETCELGDAIIILTKFKNKMNAKSHGVKTKIDNHIEYKEG